MSQNNPYGKHLPIGEVKGIPPDELVFLRECNVTHGMWLGEEGGTLEISRFSKRG